MAILDLNYYSKCLKTNTKVTVILPEIGRDEAGIGRPNTENYKTLYLLHGWSGDHRDWTRFTNIERYARDYGIAVVMPEVGRSWYTDTAYGINYFTFITEELPAFCRSYFKGMSDKREDNLIAGDSMGGYGAMKAALLCPDTFGLCACMSGSFDITRRRHTPAPLPEWRAIFGFDLTSTLDLEGTQHDLYELLRRRAAQNITFPKLYIWCGTEDGLIRANREYHELLNELGVDHCYEEGEGDHTWKWWDIHIQDALKYLLEEKNG